MLIKQMKGVILENYTRIIARCITRNILLKHAIGDRSGEGAGSRGERNRRDLRRNTGLRESVEF